ncbi:uncharacterized protein BJ212DRAFT_1307212, partial [Suillus subaureus]
AARQLAEQRHACTNTSQISSGTFRVREVQHYVGRPVTVPAPGAALVFLSSNAYAESGNPSTQTFSTTAVTKTANTARVDPSVLATSNGMSGATWELGARMSVTMFMLQSKFLKLLWGMQLFIWTGQIWMLGAAKNSAEVMN